MRVPQTVARARPVGPQALPEGGVHFRVWAPRRRSVDVVLAGRRETYPLAGEGNGYFSGVVCACRAGARYRLRLDGGGEYPDPASPFQPDGPHGASEVVDLAFPWTDAAWPGVALRGAVLYELHVGTFTQAGTWRAAAERLPELVDLGATILEIMPIAEFPGSFGWGYDGVNWFAPTRLYGAPRDAQTFVDRAHALGLGVILDVVYNHLGPDGNYLREYSDSYFARHHATEWGEALNYDGPDSGPVRELVRTNAAYWIEAFHFDGLRLDATQSIFDRSPVHIVAEVSRSARAAAGGRSIVVVAENEPQRAEVLRPVEEGGWGVDALLNDDFHHAARVAATGRSEAYCMDYRGAPQELISAAKWGYLYQGQYYAWQGKRRGSSAVGMDGASFVNFLENHDQVANWGSGLRLHRLTSPGRYRALAALLLLVPGTPLLFQGQEFASSRPFLYFAEHEGELAAKVSMGRRQFMAQFPSLESTEFDACYAPPQDRSTFERSKLDWSERDRHRPALELHRDLLRLRREDPVFRAQRSEWLHGAVLGEEAFALRYFGGDVGDRLVLVNLGRDVSLASLAEPLVAPPWQGTWRLLWSSEWPRYGGSGTPPHELGPKGRIAGHSAIVLASERRRHG